MFYLFLNFLLNKNDRNTDRKRMEKEHLIDQSVLEQFVNTAFRPKRINVQFKDLIEETTTTTYESSVAETNRNRQQPSLFRHHASSYKQLVCDYPHLTFVRARRCVDLKNILKATQQLGSKYCAPIVLCGMCGPRGGGYFVAFDSMQTKIASHNELQRFRGQPKVNGELQLLTRVFKQLTSNMPSISSYKWEKNIIYTREQDEQQEEKEMSIHPILKCIYTKTNNKKN